MRCPAAGEALLIIFVGAAYLKGYDGEKKADGMEMGYGRG